VGDESKLGYGDNIPVADHRIVFETTLGEDTKDPTTHWNSERIGRED